jgi:uncharacterized membrane protein YfcA
MPFDARTLIVALLITAAAGLVRGVTGFGGAMVMSAPLALLIGPQLMVPIVLVLESVVAAPLLWQTRALVNWRMMGTILAAACLFVPLGTLILVSLEPQVMRRGVALTVIVFAAILLVGWRYSGRPRLSTSLGLGALSGTMLGATSVGGPPVILYLLSGPDPVATTRANLTLYVTVTSLAGLAALWYHELLDGPAAFASLWLAPPYYLGLVAGTRVFAHVSDARFRQLTLVLLIAVSTGILLA